MRHPLSPIVLMLSAAPLTAAEKITYEDQVLPIFQQSCLNCHNPDKAKGGLDLSSFSATMKGSSGGKVVEPGDTGSKLLACVMQTSDKKMPPEGDKLAADKISLLKDWIEGGLLETKNSTARKASKPKFDTTPGATTTGKPEGPPPMPADVLLEPAVVAARASSVHAMCASPWAPLLAVTGQHQVLLIDTTTLELTGILPFPEGDPVSLAFTPNARYLIVGGGIPGKSGVTVTFDVVTGERMLVAAKEFDSILAADLTPDLATVASGSPSRLVKMWKAQDGSIIRSIKKHTDWVTAVDFSPDGILLATGDRGGGVWVWETGSGSEFQTLRAHQAPITAVSFRSDSNLLATASEDGSVRFWEMNGGTEVKKIDAHPGGVLSFAWFHDGSFVTSGRDRAVRVWKSDFNLLREFKDQPDILLAATCDFEGKRAFAADYRGIITAWDLETGNVAGQFDANPPALSTRIAFLHQSLQQQVAAVDAATQATSAAASQVDGAKKQISAAETSLAKAREAHASATRQNQELTQRLEALKQDRAARLPQLETLKKDLTNLSISRDQARTTATDLEARIATLTGQGDAAANQLGEARTSHQSATQSLADLEFRTQTAAALVASQEAAIAALDQEQPKLDASLAAGLETATAAEANAKVCETAFRAATDAMPAVEKTLAESNAALESARQKNNSLQQQTRRWEAAAANAEALRAKAEAERQSADAESLTAEIDALTKSLEELQAKVTSAPQEDAEIAAKLEKEKASLSTELAETKARLDQILPVAQALKDQAEQLKSRYVSLRDGGS